MYSFIYEMELSQFLQTTKALYGQYYFFAEDQYQNHDLQAHIKILHNSCLNPDKKTTLTKQVMTISRTPSVVNIQINHQTQIRYGNLNILAHPHIRRKTSIGIDQNSRRSPRWWIEGTTDILQLHNTTTTSQATQSALSWSPIISQDHNTARQKYHWATEKKRKNCQRSHLTICLLPLGNLHQVLNIWNIKIH